MSFRWIKKGTTDVSTVIRIVDSTSGAPETAVEHDTSGIALWYRRDGATQTAITEAALASLDAAHSDGGIEHIGDGYYRLDLPDAACATGVNGLLVGGTVTGMVVLGTYIPLVDHDPYDAVRMGMTALPNAAADAAGGLPISDAGGLDLDAQIGTDIDAILVDTGTTLDGKIDTIDGIVDAILVDTGTTLQGELDGIQADTEDLQTQIGTAGAGLTAVPWNAAWDAEVQSEAADALNAYDPPTKAELDTAVANVSVDEIQASALADLFNTDSGTDYASAVAGSAVKEIADNAGGSALTAEGIADAVWDEAATGHTDAGKAGAQVWTDIDAILADTNELQVDDTPAALAAILEDTGTTLPATLATIDGKVDTIDGIVDAILVDTGTTLQGELDGIQADTEDLQTQIGTAGAGLSAVPWNAAWDAEVQSEVTDAINAAGLEIKKNTALSNFEFLMVDETDHVTPETGVTVSGYRSIDGGGFAAVDGEIAEVGNGIYQFDAAAADVNGDIITWRFSGSGCADTFVTIKTRV